MVAITRLAVSQMATTRLRALAPISSSIGVRCAPGSASNIPVTSTMLSEQPPILETTSMSLRAISGGPTRVCRSGRRRPWQCARTRPLTVQRYSYGARIDIEQRLSGPWWLVAASRLRRSDYVGSESGRRHTVGYPRGPEVPDQRKRRGQNSRRIRKQGVDHCEQSLRQIRRRREHRLRYRFHAPALAGQPLGRVLRNSRCLLCPDSDRKADIDLFRGDRQARH